MLIFGTIITVLMLLMTIVFIFLEELTWALFYFILFILNGIGVIHSYQEHIEEKQNPTTEITIDADKKEAVEDYIKYMDQVELIERQHAIMQEQHKLLELHLDNKESNQ